MGELKRLTDLLGPGFLKGYTKPFQQHAGNILSLLQPLSDANEVKSLREEYDQVLRQTQVFDQLYAVYGEKNEAELREYVQLRLSVKRSIDSFRYHASDIDAKIQRGELKPNKPAEGEQDKGQKIGPDKKTPKNGWKPPKSYVGSKEIQRDPGIPRSTLEGWQAQDDVPGGELERRVKKDPQTQECYYPKKWLEKRLKSYRPRGHKT